MTEVVIDGILYVPSSDFDETLKVMEDVLKSQEFLSDSAIENIIESLKNSMETPPKTESTPLETDKLDSKPLKIRGGDHRSTKPFKYNSVTSTLYNIDKVLHDGRVVFTGGRIAKWKIQQAIKIKDSLENNSTKGMIFKDATNIAKSVCLDDTTTRRIMYNLEHGDLGVHIGTWRLNYIVNAPKRQPKPIENNPQKRRESAIYG